MGDIYIYNINIFILVPSYTLSVRYIENVLSCPPFLPPCVSDVVLDVFLVVVSFAELGYRVGPILVREVGISSRHFWVTVAQQFR